MRNRRRNKTSKNPNQEQERDKNKERDSIFNCIRVHSAKRLIRFDLRKATVLSLFLVPVSVFDFVSVISWHRFKCAIHMVNERPIIVASQDEYNFQCFAVCAAMRCMCLSRSSLEFSINFPGLNCLI